MNQNVIRKWKGRGSAIRKIKLNTKHEFIPISSPCSLAFAVLMLWFYLNLIFEKYHYRVPFLIWISNKSNALSDRNIVCCLQKLFLFCYAEKSIWGWNIYIFDTNKYKNTEVYFCIFANLNKSLEPINPMQLIKVVVYIIFTLFKKRLLTNYISCYILAFITIELSIKNIY